MSKKTWLGYALEKMEKQGFFKSNIDMSVFLWYNLQFQTNDVVRCLSASVADLNPVGSGSLLQKMMDPEKRTGKDPVGLGFFGPWIRIPF